MSKLLLRNEGGIRRAVLQGGRFVLTDDPAGCGCCGGEPPVCPCPDGQSRPACCCLPSTDEASCAGAPFCDCDTIPPEPCFCFGQQVPRQCCLIPTPNIPECAPCFPPGPCPGPACTRCGTAALNCCKQNGSVVNFFGTATKITPLDGGLTTITSFCTGSVNTTSCGVTSNNTGPCSWSCVGPRCGEVCGGTSGSGTTRISAGIGITSATNVVGMFGGCQSGGRPYAFSSCGGGNLNTTDPGGSTFIQNIVISYSHCGASPFTEGPGGVLAPRPRSIVVPGVPRTSGCRGCGNGAGIDIVGSA